MAKKTPGLHVFPAYDIKSAFDRLLELAKIRKEGELGEKLTAHSFRHTFGTLLAQQGVNAYVIQNVLRHSDANMTARYTERAKTTIVVDLAEFIALEAIEGGMK